MRDYWGLRGLQEYQDNLAVSVSLLCAFYEQYKAEPDNSDLKMLKNYWDAYESRWRTNARRPYIIDYTHYVSDLHYYDPGPDHMFVNDSKWGAYDRLSANENSCDTGFHIQVRDKIGTTLYYHELWAFDFFFRWMNEPAIEAVDFDFPHWFDLADSPNSLQHNQPTRWAAFNLLTLCSQLSARDYAWRIYAEKAIAEFPEFPFADQLLDFYSEEATGWTDTPYTCDSRSDALSCIATFCEHKKVEWKGEEDE